jgi:hypothetical protein
MPNEAMQLKEDILPGDPEEHVFSLVYLDALRSCREELDRFEDMTEQFCSSYLEALKISKSHTIEETWVAPVIVKRKSITGEDVVAIQQEQYSRAKKRRGNFAKTSTDALKKWFYEHLFHPYPTGTLLVYSMKS